MATDFTNSSSAGGPAQGGYNPDDYDAWQASMRKRSSEDLMEYSEMNNPRTRALRRQMAIGATGFTDFSSLDNYMNQTNAGGLQRYGAAMAQGMIGSGSMVDMAYGIQQATGNAGFKVSGFDGYHYGGGMANDVMARQLFDQMGNHLFDGRGMGISNRTMGRDPTEIARNMQILSSTGMWSGMETHKYTTDMGDRLGSVQSDLMHQGMGNAANQVAALRNKISGMDGAEGLKELNSTIAELKSEGGNDALVKSLETVSSTRGGLIANREAIKKMGLDLKELAKVHDSMKDVFGELESFEALAGASSLTGISTNSFNSLNRMGARLQTMKNNAQALGMSDTEFMSMSQMAGAGFSQFMGGNSGSSMGALMIPGMVDAYREGQRYTQFTGDRGGGQASQQEIMRDTIRDVQGIRAEIGGRTAASLAYSLKNDPSLDGEKRAAITAAIRDYGSASTGQAKADAEARMMDLQNSIAPVDLSTADIERGISGTVYGSMYQDAINSAQQQSIAHHYTRRGGDIEGRLLYQMDSIMGRGDTGKLLGYLRSGDISGVRKVMSEHQNDFTAAGVDHTDMFNTLRGGGQELANRLTRVSSQLHDSNENQNLRSVASRRAAETQASQIAMDKLMANANSGSSLSLRESAWALLTTGALGDIKTDQGTVAQWAANAGKIDASMLLSTDGTNINLTEEQAGSFAGDKRFMAALGLAEGDTKSLLSGNIGGAAMANALEVAGYDLQSVNIDGSGKIGVFTGDQMDDHTKAFNEESVKRWMESAGSPVNDAQAKAIAEGKWDSLGAKGAELKESVRKGLRKEMGVTGDYKARKGDRIKGGLSTQRVKDALYSKNKADAQKALYMLDESSGILSREEIDDFYREMGEDSELAEFISKDSKTYAGVDVSTWSSEEGDQYKSMNAALEKLATGAIKTDQSKGGDETTIGNMVVTNMTVLGQD